MNILTVEKFKEKVVAKYGEKFSVDYLDYVDRKTPIRFICPEHGEFFTTPENFLRRKQGCPKCEMLNMTTEEFINEARKKHGDKYNYSKCVFKGTHEKVILICSKHGEFQIEARLHLNGSGCYKCKNKKMWDTRGRVSNEDFIRKAREIHGNKYDYSRVEYVNNRTKVCIICPEHGEFWQTPNSHLNGNKCSKCSNVYKRTQSDFINDAIKIHGHKYDYSKVVYERMRTKVCIICPEHGDFWQMPDLHLKGCGCPKCKMSHIENEVVKFLKDNNVKYLYEDNINGILRRQTVDFYLPDYNIAIECQGGQHFYGGLIEVILKRKRKYIKIY